MFLIVFGRAVQLLLMVAMMRVVTTLLPPSEMGRMSLIMTTTAFFALFLVNPVGMFINRRLHSWHADGRVSHYLKYYCFYLLIVGVVAALSLAIINQINAVSFHIQTYWLIVLVSGALLINTANQTIIPSLNLLGFRGWYIVLTLGTIATGFLAGVLLILHFAANAEYWLLGLLLGQLLFASIGWKVFVSKLHPNESSDKLTSTHLAGLFWFAWPVAISVGLNWMQTQGYRFFMEDAIGLASLGLFVTGYGMSSALIAAFESVLTLYFQPVFYKEVSLGNVQGQSKAWNHYAGAILPSLILLVCLIAAVAPELTRLMLGSAYHSAYQFVIWGAIAEAARVVTGVYGMVAHARMNTRLLIMPNLMGAILSVALIWWLVPLFGAVGAGMALSLAGIAVILMMHLLMRSQFILELPYFSLMKSAGIGGLLVGVAAVLRWLTGASGGVFGIIVMLAILGACFLLLQYWMLRPLLHKQGESA